MNIFVFRKSFDKYLAATFFIKTKGKLDIIRCINDTPSHQELSSLYKSPKGEKNNVKIYLKGIVKIGTTCFNLKDYGEAIVKNVANGESFENILRVMGETVAPNVFDFIMKLTKTFLDEIHDELTELLKFFISTESVIYRMMKAVLIDYRDKTFQFIEAHASQILQTVQRQFLSLNPSDNNNPRKKCKDCEGYYTIHPL